LLAATEAIGPTPEGKTERQKIPIRLHSLAWLVWIIGRPVGWNRYYKLPDLKIMRAGWGEFEAMAAGLAMAATQGNRLNVSCGPADDLFQVVAVPSGLFAPVFETGD
jgi:hypothetical protein